VEDPAWSTFECRVNDHDALTWLARNKPEIADVLERRQITVHNNFVCQEAVLPTMVLIYSPLPRAYA
jgi:hypothetical protein